MGEILQDLINKRNILLTKSEQIKNYDTYKIDLLITKYNKIIDEIIKNGWD